MSSTGHPLPRWVLAALFVTAVAINASDYSVLVPQQPVRRETHRAVMDGRAPAPQRYRVLVPFALDPMIDALSRVMPGERAFSRAYGVFHLFALTLLLGTLFVYLREWFTEEQALVGSLLVGSALRLALRQNEYLDLAPIPTSGVFAPSSLLDPSFLALGLLLMLRERRWLLAGVIAVASLNSEAAVLLPVAFLATHVNNRRDLRDGLGYLFLWGAVALGVRYGVGAAGPQMDALPLPENLQHLPTAALNVTLFLGPVWLLVAAGWRRTPAFARRAMLAATVYLVGVAIWSSWWDVRVLMPLYPLLMPPVLAALFEPTRATA